MPVLRRVGRGGGKKIEECALGVPLAFDFRA